MLNLRRFLLLAVIASLSACVSTDSSQYTTRTGINRADFEASLPSGHARAVTSFAGKVDGETYDIVQVEQYTLPGGQIIEAAYRPAASPDLGAHLGSGTPYPPNPRDELLGK